MNIDICNTFEVYFQIFRNFGYKELKNSDQDILPAYGGPKTAIWKYQYDADGNWTKATKYNVISGDIQIEQELETITRKYEYYE